jgi:3-deoxy-D-manno-octulosonate 8-phosphate phosphatase (KDO 8-P phosphatase)
MRLHRHKKHEKIGKIFMNRGQLTQAEVLQRATHIRMVVFDVDGVLTDGTLYLGDGGEEYKAFYSRDGLGMKLLQASGVELGIITGRSSQVVLHRMESLGIKHVFQGRTEKLPAFQQLCSEANLAPDYVAFVGDDIIDLPVIQSAGLGIAVADAHPLVVRHAHWQTEHPGGRGAARDVCELIMQAQGTWAAQLARYDIMA